ncbi:MAG: copper oxidase [Myxococcaceae bacterium]|nr:copper oxidase [Myxococcaceae bacterium]
MKTSDPGEPKHEDTFRAETTPPSRREVLKTGGAAAVLLASARAAAAQSDVPGAARPRHNSAAATGRTHAKQDWLPPGLPNRDYRPVVVPNGSKLRWKIVDGVKVFHLVAEEVTHTFAPGLEARCWGYNGRVHGPVIEAVEGDRVRFYVTNRLPAPTTVHWHGMLVPNGMDGVGGLTQKAIAPGETYWYEFTLRHSGTFMYHSHHDEMTQMALGMVGMFVVHPRRLVGPRIDRDFAIMLHEWRIDAGARRPNPNEMTDFNVLTMNAKVFPATAPLVAKTGEHVRIRFGNLSAMDHHPIHLHGYQFLITETDGGRIAPSAQWPETTVLVPVGSTRTIEFVADEPGDWAMHCHMTHHVMNQMGHGIPNMVGVAQPRAIDQRAQKLLPGYMTMGQTGMGEMSEMGMAVPTNSIPMLGGRGKYDVITMGGMFSVLKVRDHLASYADPGWYDAPAGTTAVEATEAQLRRDGIDPSASSGAEPGDPAIPS